MAPRFASIDLDAPPLNYGHLSNEISFVTDQNVELGTLVFYDLYKSVADVFEGNQFSSSVSKTREPTYT